MHSELGMFISKSMYLHTRRETGTPPKQEKLDRQRGLFPVMLEGHLSKKWINKENGRKKWKDC